MKPNEPSRTALMIARQRAAHQVLDHGSILDDPFAMKILREDEKDVLQFANKHPLASIGRLFTAARSRIAEDALSRAVERGVRQIVILGAGLDTFALRNPHGGQIRSMRWTTPRRRHGNASAWPKLKSHFRHGLFSCQSISSGTMWERSSSPQAFSRTRPRFSLARGCALSDTGRYRPHSGLHVVNPELGGGVRLHGTSRGILRRAKANRKGADRTA
jgi:hypothetical protein